MALFWLRWREIGHHTTGRCEDWFIFVGCIRYSNLGISRAPYVIFLPSKLFLVCWLTSSDVFVSALRTRSMVNAVGTVAAVEELAISAPANQTSPNSVATGERPPWVWLRSNPCRTPSANS